MKLGQNVYIHPQANVYDACLGDDVRVAAFAEIGGAVVGARCKIQAHAFIPRGVELGDEVFIGPGVCFTNDPWPRAVGDWEVVPTFVRAGASLGAGVIVLPGVTIGARAMIGAGSVVTHDVAPGSCVLGVPARERCVSRDSDNGQDVLLILNPRHIPQAIRSLRALPIDKVWFRAFEEVDLAPRLNQFIHETRYRNYLLVSDDVVVQPAALDCVLDLLAKHPAATGYCRLALDNDRVNLTRTPVGRGNGRFAAWEDYDFYRFDEVAAAPGPLLSWFGGWTLTGMRRDLWLRYPFQVNAHTGRQSDFELADRLARDNCCFRSHPAASVEHLKPTRNGDFKAGWLVGRLEPTVTWDFADRELLAGESRD